jgi:hypothetical protein
MGDTSASGWCSTDAVAIRSLWPASGQCRRQERKDNVVNLTERAGALLERIQSEESLPHPLRIELAREDGQFAMGMTEPAPDDEVLYHEDTPVLYISAPAAAALADCTLTTQETAQGTTLAVLPPGVPGGGESTEFGD